MSKKNLFLGALPVALMVAVLMLLTSGCSSGPKIDKAAVMEVKKVAVVIYTVPATIEFYEDPREHKKTALQIAAAVATADNGRQAANLAHQSFIENLNKQGLGFTVMTKAAMMNNTAFMNASNKYVSMRMEEAAKHEKKKGGAEKVMGMLSALGGGGGGEEAIGVSPEGLPEFGLAPSWNVDSALTGAPGEMDYVKAAIKALGVDAALVINDPGMAFGCDACVGGTGSATTSSAFLATMVDSDGQPIMEMQQWFAIGGGSAVMTGYVVNPLQYEGLFNGHGEKMARVFADEFKDAFGK